MAVKLSPGRTKYRIYIYKIVCSSTLGRNRKAEVMAGDKLSIAAGLGRSVRMHGTPDPARY